MTCNNSALNPNIVIQGAGGVGSKTAITVVQNNHGFSAGTAVRWNSGVDGTAARQNLVDNHSWTITDGDGTLSP